MSLETILFLLAFFDCQGDALVIDGLDLEFQHYEVASCVEARIEDCPVENTDFAVIVDGEYLGWLSSSRASCLQWEDESGWNSGLRMYLEQGEYWGSGYLELNTHIHRNGFE